MISHEKPNEKGMQSIIPIVLYGVLCHLRAILLRFITKHLPIFSHTFNIRISLKCR